MPSGKPNAPCYARRVRRLILSLVLTLLQLGCADALGLGGLTFEREGTDQSTSASGGAPSQGHGAGGQPVQATGGESGGESATGGTPITPRDLGEGEYFKNIGARALLSASYVGWGAADLPPPDSYVVVSRPEGPSLLHLQLALDAEDVLGTSPVQGQTNDRPWTHLLQWEHEGAPQLIGYQASSGLLFFGQRPVPNQVFAPEVKASSNERSHLFVLGPTDAPFLFSYSRDDGSYRLAAATPDLAASRVSAGAWPEQPEEVVRFSWNGQEGVLLLSSGVGDASFLGFDDGQLGPPQALGIPAPEWTHALSFRSDDSVFLLLYSSLIGTTQLVSFGEAEENGSTIDEAFWPSGATQLLPVSLGGVPWMLTYNSASGIVDLFQLMPLADTSVVK